MTQNISTAESPDTLVAILMIMRYSFIIFFISVTQCLFCQTLDQVGQLRLTNAKIISVDTASENICEHKSKVVRLTIIARTKVQMTCDFGDPSNNIYDSINTKLYICYAHDSTQKIYEAVLNDIRDYLKDREEWANRYGTGNDFTYSAFSKSFFLNGNMAIPFIMTESENPGDYHLFYLNNQVYKIILAERNGLGNLSSFVEQNMYFVNNGQKVDLGEYIKNIDTVKQIIAKK